MNNTRNTRHLRLPRALALVATLVGLGMLCSQHLQANVELEIVNNFASSKGTEYFGGHIEDADVYLYFTGGFSGGDITYNGGTHVTAEQRIKLSDVNNRKFTMTNNVNAARAYAILGSGAPSTIPSTGPDSVTVTYPYSYIEFTTQTNGRADQSFINQVAFPTKLTNGSQTNTWAASTTGSVTAQTITNAFHTAFPSAPYAPASGKAPGSADPYDPYYATSVGRTAGSDTSTLNGHRIIGSSNVNIPAASAPPQQGTAYTNVTGFNDYLKWLQNNEPSGGWDISYDSNTGGGSVYVGKLAVTGTDNNYGLELSNFTYGGTLNSNGTMTGGTSVTGNITYAANNSEVEVFGVPDYKGNWTDMTLFTAAEPVTGAVSLNGDLGGLDTASVLYTVSGAIGAGILGSDGYKNSHSNTNHFFQSGLTPSNALDFYFTNSKFNGEHKTGFYDQYWFTLLDAGGLNNGIYAGYFTPYDDHFNTLGVQMASDSGTLKWELGITELSGTDDEVEVPEPTSLVLLGIGSMLVLTRRRR